ESGGPGRPDQKMVAAAMAGGVEVLLVDSLEQERAIRALERQRVRIVTASDGYASTGRARKIHRGFRGMMNELFLDALRDKTRRGLEGAARRGMSVGGRAYGYNSEPVVDELWERVKARQREQSARVGARVRAGLTVGEARRTGR